MKGPVELLEPEDMMRDDSFRRSRRSKSRQPPQPDDPLATLIRNENRDQRLTQEEREALEECLRPRVLGLMEAELMRFSPGTMAELKRLDPDECRTRYDQLGYFVSYLTDVCQYDFATIAPFFGRDADNIRVAKWRALRGDHHPCGEPGRCARKPGCAHTLGRGLWDDLVSKVTLSLWPLSLLH